MTQVIAEAMTQPLLFDGLTVMARLRALGEFKRRIKRGASFPAEEVCDYITAAAPPPYYDTVRLTDITRGADTLIGTISLHKTEAGIVASFVATAAMPKGARISGWGSIGEMPTVRPRSIDIFVVCERAV